MVNCNSLNKIMEFVESHHLKKMKKCSQINRERWDGQKSTHVYKLRKQLRKLLSLLSGNNICEMLKGCVIYFNKFYFIRIFLKRCSDE